jgi:tetratricopeptide (TPR) repeat protein
MTFSRLSPALGEPPSPSVELQEQRFLEGNGHLLVRRYAEAEESYGEVLRHDEQHLPARLWQAVARGGRGNVLSAFGTLVAQGDVEPGRFSAVGDLTDVVPPEAVRKMLQEIQQEPPDSRDARSRIREAQAHIYLNEPERADRILSSLEPDPETQADLLYYRGHVALQLGRTQEALRCFEDAVKVDSMSPFPYRKRALWNMKGGGFDSAMRDLGQYLKLRPDDASAWYAYGHCLEQLGKEHRTSRMLAAAVKAYDKAMACSGDHQLCDSAVAQARRLRRLLTSQSASPPGS